MNDRKDWNNFGEFMPPNQQAGIFPTFCSVPTPLGFSPTVGITPNNWAHVPPQTMPWGTPPESQPAIVRFTAGDFNSHLIPIKRKCESVVDIPSKMLVTEEKMAAHLRDLHISDVEPPEMSSMVSKEEPMEAERLPKLVIKDEIKNFKTESIIPESILKKLEKPEMALVLWHPPATDLTSKLRELKKLSLNKSRSKQNENKDEGEMDIAIETDNKSTDNVFRPIDPVPKPPMQNQFFQPVPQFHANSQFSSNMEINFQTKFT